MTYVALKDRLWCWRIKHGLSWHKNRLPFWLTGLVQEGCTFYLNLGWWATGFFHMLLWFVTLVPCVFVFASLALTGLALDLVTLPVQLYFWRKWKQQARTAKAVQKALRPPPPSEEPVNPNWAKQWGQLPPKTKAWAIGGATLGIGAALAYSRHKRRYLTRQETGIAAILGGALGLLGQSLSRSLKPLRRRHLPPTPPHRKHVP